VTDDELVMKYLDGQALSDEEIKRACGPACSTAASFRSFGSALQKGATLILTPS
jgi:hypothetical protein